jgi:uncharacterized membrane protein YdbT with pleckstrin-like domain
VPIEMMAGEKLIWEGHPSWRAVVSLIARGVLGALAVAAVVILIDRLGGPESFTTWGIVIGVVGIGLTILLGWLKRFFTTYTITTRRINIRTGVLAKREASTTIDRIQNMTITQTVLDRMLRTGTIDFDTASSDASDRFQFFGINAAHTVREQVQRAQDARAGESTTI